MGANMVFYFSVDDVPAALASLRAHGFSPTDGQDRYEDPAPPVIGAPDVEVRRLLVKDHIQSVVDQFAANAAVGFPTPEADSIRFASYLCYSTSYRWPEGPDERQASMIVVARVRELCHLLGSRRFICLADSAHPVELDRDTIERATHDLLEMDPDVIFRE